MATLTRHDGRWTLDDRFASPWHYLPVEVPAGSSGIEVELSYDQRAGTLDLGCLGPDGFRGWSGGARQSFVISAGGATPGYLAGDLEPGTWQVMIGIYRVGPEGIPYRLTARVSSSPLPRRTGPAAPPPPARPSRRWLPAASGHSWLAGDLHSHTVHSDGSMSVPELARLAVEQGLDFLAVSDHNTVSHHRELAAASARYGITLLPGQEVTTGAGHAGVLGDVGWVDFRRSADDWLAHAQRHGGLMAVNHPIAGELSWMHAMGGRPPLVEVWHWSWLDARWTTPLAWWQAWDPAAVPVGGSDWHRPGSDAPPGSPTTWVQSAGPDVDCILDALGSGRVAISARRCGPVLVRHADEVVAAGADGTILVGPDGPRAVVRGDLASFRAPPGPHRLTDASGATLALTP